MLIASTPLLCECIPTKVGFYIPAATIRDGRKQADRAFARFFKRTRTSRTELVVCHGNIIRYFIARAMGMKLTAWRSMAIFHASITDIRIHSDGRAILFAYNDVGHLPAKLRTMSAKAPKSMVRKMETETKTAKKAKAKVRAKKRALKPA